ncbi:regulatory protein RecX [Desulfosarcina ovata]|uniref:Regulatory protein RecX n=1 Tax=Desulfosarcina ovata subsp. ovata TaxID=2752305 RepID=A0A5K8AEG8_9BACT|nr:regulatory protein RecX [Desulfosarcina ovata]BBO91093.1 recombination regulator RecX [Desulfosarcina ovata subsp. ovata]
MPADRSQKNRTPEPAAMESAFRILARRDHTCQELSVKLRAKGFARSAIDHALKRCRDLGYLNDDRVAGAMAGQLARRGYGPLRIRQTLLQKGLDEGLVDRLTGQWCGEDDQVRTARRLLEKRRSRLDRESDAWKRRQKAYRYLAGRGFEADAIHRAIDGF